MQTSNKDTVGVTELGKACGLDKTEVLLATKSSAPYDELKLRETNRANDDLKHKITQAQKDNDEYSNKLINLRAKNSEMTNQVKVLQNYKIINEQIKSELTQDQEELRVMHRDEEKLREQNEYLGKIFLRSSFSKSILRVLTKYMSCHYHNFL